MGDDRIHEDKLLLFRETIKLLKEFNVVYWLDQGSLLGAVRNNAFLSWDHDVDMGAWYDDIDIVRKITDRLADMGALVSFFEYVVKIRILKNGVSSIPVNIRFYYRRDGYAYSEFWSVMNKKALLNKTMKGMMRFSSNGINWLYANNRQHGVAGSIASPALKFLYNKAVNMREMFKVRRIIFRADEKYLLKLKDKNIHGIDVKIPSESESYLEFKYGKDWKKPNKDWVWWREDGALFSTDMFPVSIRGMKKRLNINKSP